MFKMFLKYFLMGGKDIGHDVKLTNFLKNHPGFRKFAFFIHDTNSDLKNQIKDSFDDLLKKEDKLKEIDNDKKSGGGKGTHNKPKH